MKNYLFVTEKFCDTNPNMGFTNSFRNFFTTLSSARPLDNFNTLHSDESFHIYGKHIDQVLLEYCAKYPVDVVFFTFVGDMKINPSTDVIQKLKDLGKQTVCFWHDSGPSYGLQTIKSLEDLVTLNISIDAPSGTHIDSYNKKDNHLFLWTPQDETLFYRPTEKTIDISFLGTKKYIDRSQYVMALKNRFPKMVISGGQRENRISPEKYAEITRQSKIGVNFSMSETLVFHQLKGRVLEYLSTGGLLLEGKNPSTAAYFTPGQDYVEFQNFDDLSDKIEYYLSHEDEAGIISNNGYIKYVQNYTSQRFWDVVMSALENKNQINVSRINDYTSF